MSLSLTILLVMRFWNWALILQAFEYLALRQFVGANWTYRVLNIAQIGIAIVGLYSSSLMVVPALLFIHLLRLALHGGIFNGGSDYMVTTVGVGLMVAFAGSFAVFCGLSVHQAKWTECGLFYIGAQVLWSYLSAGWSKLTRRAWWRGETLSTFLATQGRPQFLKLNPQIISVVVIVWEMAALPVILMPQLLPWYLLSGLIFHLLNFFVFGLNRFFWAWLAAYPAFAFLINTISKFV